MILSSAEKIKEYTNKGWWTTVTFDELFRRNVLRSPNKVAIVDPMNRGTITDGPVRELTYWELEQEVNGIAHTLIKYGVKKDDVVAIQLPNSVEIVATFLAVMRIGAIASPLPIQYREYELEQLLTLCEATAIITMTNIRGREVAKTMLSVQDKVSTIKQVFAWGNNVPANVVSLNSDAINLDIEELNEYLYSITVTANDIFTICWTSGTEGRSKGVPRSQNEWYCSSYASVDLTEVTERDVIMNPFPMVNMAGIAGLLIPWLLTGCKLVQHHPFDVDTFLKQIEMERVTYTFTAPAMLNMLLKDENLLAEADISSIRYLGSGSSPLSPWVIQTWFERFGIQVINFFGSNEGTSLSSGHIEVPDFTRRATLFPRYGVEGLTWISRTAQRIETKIVDLKTGKTITEPNVPGELRIRGASIFAGYWNEPELTKAAFDENGFFCTGDTLEIAGTGEDAKFYRMVGRSKDIVIRGGMNISPLELEGLLEGHEKIADVAIVGYPDEVLGEKVCACIVPKSNQSITLDEVSSFLRQKKVASYKMPERVEIFTELPRNPVGKILKHDLKESISKTLV